MEAQNKSKMTDEERLALAAKLDNDLDGFIKSYLMKRASGTLGEAAPNDDEA